MRTIAFFFAWVLGGAFALGAEEGTVTWTFKSPKANEVVRKYQAARKNLDDGYVEERKKNRAAFIAKLQEQVKVATKANDLDEAIAIRDAIKVLNDESALKISDTKTDKPPGEGDEEPQLDAATPRSAAGARTGLSGGGGGTRFDETGPKGGYLIGFRTSTRLAFGVDGLASVQAIYSTRGGGQVFGEVHGVVNNNVQTVIAKKGYAVAGLNTRAGLNLNGFEIVFMKKKGATFDARTAYKSQWLGDKTGGGDRVLTTGGREIVGIFGGASNELVGGMGLIAAP